MRRPAGNKHDFHSYPLNQSCRILWCAVIKIFAHQTNNSGRAQQPIVARKCQHQHEKAANLTITNRLWRHKWSALDTFCWRQQFFMLQQILFVAWLCCSMFVFVAAWLFLLQPVTLLLCNVQLLRYCKCRKWKHLSGSDFYALSPTFICAVGLTTNN